MRLLPSFPIVASMAAMLVFAPVSPAWAFLGMFNKATVKKAPTGAELAAQEAAANALLTEARASGKASLYDDVLKRYPFTNAAGEAAYLRAVNIRQNGKLKDAFNAFQDLISNYRQSARFADAVQQQYELAEEAKSGKKQRSVILVPMKIGPNETIGLYEKVIANAPFGKFAALAQFSIAEIHQEQQEKNEAVAAYQKVVDNYPTTKEAAEAQFRIGAISNIAAKKTEDSQNLTASRDALKTYVATNPGGERASEAQTMLSAIDREEAARSLQIGKFYERSGKPKAAVIYYNEALKFGDAEVSAEARQLLANVSNAAPAEVADIKAKAGSSGDYTVPAAVDLRSRADYVGPPSPELARLSAKPKMRKDGDSFSPIPLQEPALPTKPDAGATGAPGTLLPPVAGDKPPTLPIPPPPAGIPAQPAPPIPPPPADPAKK
jgi:outer membrane protein assembly factor BamD (BamD/ComL family)